MMLPMFEMLDSTVVSWPERNASLFEQELNHGNRVFHRVFIQVKEMNISEGNVLESGLYANADVSERVHCCNERSNVTPHATPRFCNEPS